MAANIPAQLRQAGITPFIVRAAQLETAKPVISYWCEYWAVNQILKKQLHSADEECLNFTTTLMDKLEQTKIDQAGNDAILDDDAGRAYVEQFAQETFERAMRPLKANKVTQQTASTFEAAATFFQLVQIWGQPEQEVLDKIKFAKWNAARILKAIKEGKDPNESNPKQPEAEEDVVPALDPNDPEVQDIEAAKPKPATVEDVPDSESRLQPQSGYSHLAPASVSPATVSAPTSPLPPSAQVPEQVSPIGPADDPPTEDPGSYFPDAPAASDQEPLQLPSAPGAPPPALDSDEQLPAGPPPTLPDTSAHGPAPSVPTPQDFYHQPAPPPQPSQPPSIRSPPVPPPQQQQPQAFARAPIPHHNMQPSAPSPYSHQPQAPVPQAAPVPQTTQSYGSGGSDGPFAADDVAQAKAQKHAKWAISALNFEDVPTAVRELRLALAALGAR